MERAVMERRVLALVHDPYHDDLLQRTIERRSVEAVIWGMPIVSVDAMRQAFFRDARAKYGDIVYWSKPSDWRFQTTTPNASTRYVYFNFNTKDGPVVFEVPPTIEGGLFGSLLDAWQTPLMDVGPEGEDQGRGGKYLLLPPDFKGEVPANDIVIRSETYNGYALLRAIPASSSPADVSKAIEIVKKLRIYPLAMASNPPEQRHIDMADKLFDGIVAYDDTFFDRLTRILNEEPVQTRDLVAMAQLRSLGIDKGLPFNPDDQTRKILKKAIDEAHEAFMEACMNLSPYWPGSKWGLHTLAGPRTGFSFRTANEYDIDERGLVYYLGYAPAKGFGAATFYLAGVRDGGGKPLTGGNSYRLHVPADVPAKQYWAVTVYDLASASFILESPSLGVDSYNQKLQKNSDGSVDVYFGPNPPAGKNANWVYTEDDNPWFALFRFYGPEKGITERTWRLADFERIN
jgi:hypothetical protein